MCEDLLKANLGWETAEKIEISVFRRLSFWTGMATVSPRHINLCFRNENITCRGSYIDPSDQSHPMDPAWKVSQS